ncbi:hypothetical protein E3N88_36715 [Mikania micrantha]|uniref:Ubiquitin-like protease family profile domain-containing protein n=1 Tax=Mikania micrantha TaxID=192012 RepID=A0A5N6M4J7_9ASTR|nr:hypothetical protein E3N88_36715 [Mikania micrantha]
MDNRRNKQSVNNEYNSQPVQKASTWVFQKWRRTTKNAKEQLREEQPPEEQPQEEPEYTHNKRSVHRQHVRKWAILDDESENWSTNVEQFYLNGDAPFCYSGVFNTPLPLDRSFWGTMLGYTSNGYLSQEHIQGWVGRMMNWRQRQQQKGATNMRWSILPPQFYDYLVDSCTKNTVSFANGKSSPFPSFFDVDYVYFPFCVENNEWLLVQVKLRNVNLEMFCKNGFSPKVMSFEVNKDYVQSQADLHGNQGVHACMLMEHLVTGKPLNISNNFRESCIAYRRFMADQMYFWRCLPRPG